MIVYDIVMYAHVGYYLRMYLASQKKKNIRFIRYPDKEAEKKKLDGLALISPHTKKKGEMKI